MSITPDYAKSIDFLRKFHPGRRWTLTGIHPDLNFKPRTVTATFDENTEAKCLAWLADKGQMFNLYFSVNECKGFMLKKAERSDIMAMWYIHVDIDPNTGEPIDAEQRRILELLTHQTKLPPASIVTFSGGGFQAFWSLETPIEINGDEAKYEDAKLYNLAVEVALGADNCHNVDRIMRLVGTINRPDAKKLAKGRTEALAELIRFDDVKYGIDRFAKSAPVKSNASKTIGTATPAAAVTIDTANIKRIGSLDEIKAPEWIKVLINCGYDSNNPNILITKKYPSRSEALFAVVCGLVKAAITDDVIHSIITDPRFGISASVLESGRGADEYATRQIVRARAEVNEPDLAEFNAEYTFVREFGGKPAVVWKVDEVIGRDEHGNERTRSRLVKMSPDTFASSRRDRKRVLTDAKGNTKAISLADWWMDHPLASRVDRVQFAPEQQLPANVLNLWDGFALSPKSGDWSLLREHIRTIICSGQDEHFDYLIRWMANAVQRPYLPGYSAVVLKGGEGIGKGVFVSAFGSLFGRHFMQVSDERYITGNFNGHLHDCVVLFADEAFFAGDKKQASTTKRLVTEETLIVEYKGIEPIAANNYLHVIMASNEAHVVPAGVNARRFFVLKVNESRMNDYAYFTAITDQMSNGGLAAMLHDLKTMDLRGFNVRHVPKTDELADQKARTMSRVESILYEAIAAGRLPCGEKSPANAKVKNSPFTEVRVETRDLLQWFNADRAGFERPMNFTGLRSLIAAWIGLEPVQSNGKTFYRVPSLSECRAAVERHLQQRIEWPKVATLDERSDEERQQDLASLRELTPTERQRIVQAGRGPEDQTGWVVEVPAYNF